MTNDHIPTEAELKRFYGPTLKDFEPYYVAQGRRLAGPTGESLDRHTIDYICKRWGSLRDLPEQLVPVIWVSTRQCLKVVMTAEINGELSPTKNMLVGDRKLLLDFQRVIPTIDFIERMISYIRAEQPNWKRLGAAQLVIDFLKWRIMDVEEKSVFRRLILRQFAKAHPDYEQPIPPEISL
jgi:hypothetical protein